MSKTSGELRAAAARLEVSEETLKRAQADAQRARDAARGAAISARFTDEGAAAQAEITPSDEQQISKEVEAHRAERRTVETRITELTSELGDAEVSEETLDAAETAASQLRADLGAAERSEAELKTRIEMLTKAIDRAKELRVDLN